MAFCRIVATWPIGARNHVPKPEIPKTMEPKYRTLLQAVAIAAVFATVWHFQQPEGSRVADSVVQAE